MSSNIQVFPVTAWGMGQAPTHKLGLLRFAFLSQPGQAPEAAEQGPVYGLTPQQLRALSASLLQTADALEASAPKK